MLQRLIEEHLERALEAPGDVGAVGRLAVVYEANSLLPEAARVYGAAARLEPEEPIWAYHRALCLKESGAFEEGLVELEELAQREPDWAALQHRLACWLYEGDEVERAHANFERALELEPNAPVVHVGMSNALRDLGDAPGALRHADLALGREPENRAAHYARGLALLELGREEEAARHLQHGLGAPRSYLVDRLMPEVARMTVSSQAVQATALAVIDAGMVAEGVALLEGCLVEKPDDVQLMNNLAFAYRRMGRLEDAHRILMRALEADGSEFEAITRVNLVDTFLERGGVQEAVEQGELAVVVNPTLGRAHFALGRAQAAAGRDQEALASFRRAVRLDSRGIEGWVALGNLCVELGQLEEARESYATAVERVPGFFQGHARLAEVCLELELLDEAQEALEAARSLAPGHRRVALLERRLGEARAR